MFIAILSIPAANLWKEGVEKGGNELLLQSLRESLQVVPTELKGVRRNTERDSGHRRHVRTTSDEAEGNRIGPDKLCEESNVFLPAQRCA